MTKPRRPLPSKYIPYSDGNLDQPILHNIDEDPVQNDELAMFEKPITDNLISAELNLPQVEKVMTAKVIGRAKDENGNVMGSYDPNPIMNTIVYNVEFPDGAVREYSANVIAENMYAQVDTDGFAHSILDGIVDYVKDDTAVTKDESLVDTESGQHRTRKSTAGWNLLVAWKNGSEQWIPLSILKKSNPIEVAEFAVAKGIADEPAFNWWVPYTLRKRDIIISGVNARVKKVTHKYGVEVNYGSSKHMLINIIYI